MKKWMSFCLIAALLLLNGCSFKVKQDTFNIPKNAVESIEIQKAYTDENGETVYRSKIIDDAEDVEAICAKIRTLPVSKIISDEPNPIRSTPLIIILKSEAEHRLILNEEMAFYDQMPYEYQRSDTFEDFLALYDDLVYEENETEAKPL